MFSKFFNLFKSKVTSNRLKPLHISELTVNEKAIVSAEYKSIGMKIHAYNDKTRSQRRELAALNNDKCPHCKSTNVNNRISRIQGSLKGSSYGNYSLFGGSISGNISGSLDTNEVNKCNDCQNEWKVMCPHQYTYLTDYEVIQTLARNTQRLQNIINGDVKWNPDDLDETCASKEEKIQKEIKYYTDPENYVNREIFEFLSGLSLETINYLVEVKIGEYPTLNEDVIKNWRKTDYQILADYYNIKPLRNNNL